MSRPYFAGTRDDVPRRGATSSKAGLDLPRRVAGLEQGIESVTPAGIMTTRGDLIRRGASAPERVALGTAGQHLTSNGTDAVWRSRFSTAHRAAGRYASGIGTTAFVVNVAGSVYYYATSGSAASTFLLSPADYGGSSISVKIRWWVQTETDPTDSTLTVSLLPVTSIGAAGTIGSVGAAIASAAGTVAAAAAEGHVASSEGTISEDKYVIVSFAHNVNPAQAMTYGYEVLARPL